MCNRQVQCAGGHQLAVRSVAGMLRCLLCWDEKSRPLGWCEAIRWVYLGFSGVSWLLLREVLLDAE